MKSKKLIGGAALLVGLAILPSTADGPGDAGLGSDHHHSSQSERFEHDSTRRPTARTNWQARITTKGATDVLRPREQDRAGWNIRLALPSGTEHRDRQVRHGDVLHGRRSDLHAARRPAGYGFVDDGDDDHVVRNEGTVDTVVYVTSLVPKGAARRIDEPDPGNCPS